MTAADVQTLKTVDNAAASATIFAIKSMIFGIYFSSGYGELYSEISSTAHKRRYLFGIIAKDIATSLFCVFLIIVFVTEGVIGLPTSYLSHLVFCLTTYIAVGAVFEPVKYLPLLFIKHKSRGNTQWKVTGRLAH